MAKCELCGHPIRNFKTMRHQPTGKIIEVCWECYRREMKAKNSKKSDLVSISDIFNAELLMTIGKE